MTASQWALSLLWRTSIEWRTWEIPKNRAASIEKRSYKQHVLPLCISMRLVQTHSSVKRLNSRNNLLKVCLNFTRSWFRLEGRLTAEYFYFFGTEFELEFALGIFGPSVDHCRSRFRLQVFAKSFARLMSNLQS